MDFGGVLASHGFRQSDERRSGAGRSTKFASSPNRFLTYTVHVDDDGTALFSWEFAIADYLATRGIQVGSAEALNQFLYPIEDVRGPQDGAWLAAAIDEAERQLASVRLDEPDTEMP